MSVKQSAFLIMAFLLLSGCARRTPAPAGSTPATPTQVKPALTTAATATPTRAAPAPTATPYRPTSTPAPPTPPPTSSPTPKLASSQYNLVLLVKKPDGRPIPGAEVRTGDRKAQAGPDGVVSFANLGAGPVTLTVSAPGFITQELSPALQAGHNQVEVILAPEPSGQTPGPAPAFSLRLELTEMDGRPLAAAALSRVSLLDENDQPLEGIEPVLTPDAQGVISLPDLPGGVIHLIISAPGYLPLDMALILERDEEAELSLALERDTLGLAPDQACASGEELLYIEDFNDGQAQGWPNVSAAVEQDARNGWSILEEPSGNLLLQAADGAAPASDYLENARFDDAVWRLKVFYEGNDTDGFLNWRRSFEPGDQRYIIPFGGPHLLQLLRLAGGKTVQAAGSSFQLKPGVWHPLEISAYQGEIEVWLDNKKVFSYTDPQPLPAGTIGLEMHLKEGVQTVFWFDDLAVCGLSAPFVPLARAP